VKLAKSIATGVASGVAFIIVVLLAAFGYVWLNPEGGDSWDAVYFFTHPAFFVLFAIGFTVGFLWSFRKSSSSTQVEDTTANPAQEPNPPNPVE
jgi:peptidoglycan/LPS O-acetylase OafA/YrhL